MFQFIGTGKMPKWIQWFVGLCLVMLLALTAGCSLPQVSEQDVKMAEANSSTNIAIAAMNASLAAQPIVDGSCSGPCDFKVYDKNRKIDYVPYQTNLYDAAINRDKQIADGVKTVVPVIGGVYAGVRIGTELIKSMGGGNTNNTEVSSIVGDSNTKTDTNDISQTSHEGLTDSHAVDNHIDNQDNNSQQNQTATPTIVNPVIVETKPEIITPTDY